MAVEPGADRRAHVGRQPIYDRDGAVVGYELLFRAATTDSAAGRWDGHATARVLVAAFTEFGIEEIADGRVCFLNITREFVTGALPLPFDGSQAVLEILASAGADEEVVAGMTVLVERGFTMAVDDYAHGAGREALLPLATYAKIDMLNVDDGRARAAVQECRKYPHLQLVATRLETTETLRLAFELGFDLFQGHVLGRPHVSSTVALAPSRLARLRILAELSADEVDIDALVEKVSQDAALSLRLLRATNAAAFGLTRTVASIRDAVVAMGLNRLRQWVTLMLVADLTDANPEQLTEMLVRARLCQLLAEDTDAPTAAAYIGGLLSAVADHFQEPVESLVAGVPLDEALRAALIDGSGTLGQVLANAKAYTDAQTPSWPGTTEVEPGRLVTSYLAALRWTTSVMRTLSADLPTADKV